MFTVLGTDTYLKEISKWSKPDKEAAEKISSKLKENPFLGDPLNYKFLRERRVKEMSTA